MKVTNGKDEGPRAIDSSSLAFTKQKKNLQRLIRVLLDSQPIIFAETIRFVINKAMRTWGNIYQTLPASRGMLRQTDQRRMFVWKKFIKF